MRANTFLEPGKIISINGELTGNAGELIFLCFFAMYKVVIGLSFSGRNMFSIHSGYIPFPVEEILHVHQLDRCYRAP